MTHDRRLKRFTANLSQSVVSYIIVVVVVVAVCNIMYKTLLWCPPSPLPLPPPLPLLPLHSPPDFRHYNPVFSVFTPPFLLS